MNCEQMKALGINEIFLPIDGFESYEISNYGNVRNSKSGVHKSVRLMNKGYYITDLYDDNHVWQSRDRYDQFTINLAVLISSVSIQQFSFLHHKKI